MIRFLFITNIIVTFKTYDMTNEEIQEFLEQQNPVIEDVNSAQSFKTNLLKIRNSLNVLLTQLNKIKTFVVYLYSLIDIERITNDVLSNIQETKSFVTINTTLGINEIVVDGDYSIKRVENNIVEITKLIRPETWNVDNIIVTVKDFDGAIHYPAVITKDNVVSIAFLDGIGSNYRVILF